MMLRGYRDTDRHLLSGPWPPGELLGLPLAEWPALAEPTSVPPPSGPDAELCVLSGVGFVRYAELDWVHRRARLEIGIAPAAQPVGLDVLVKTAVANGFSGLNLNRLYGWVTPSTVAPEVTSALAAAGFAREATVDGALWLGGPVTRELWGAVRDE
jgi:hypothetical protein